MFAPRSAVRSARVLQRKAPRSFRNTRFQSTSSPNHGNGSSNPAIVGGIAGGAVTFLAGYAWYHFSGAKTVVQTSKSAKAYVDSMQKKLKEATPEPNEALQQLRQTATYYARFIPGASGYVETAFDDLDSIRAKHGDEVDKIVREAYEELKGVSKKGMTVQTAQEAWDVIQTHMKRIFELAGDAASDIVNNHPELKSKVGGSLDQLKQMGEQYGPEAKKQVDQTWDQIRDILNSGISAETADKIRKVVQEKVDMVKKMGDEAWKKGLEQAKPYLDKNPKVKELVEKNKDSLMQGNMQELWEKVKSAAESGNTGDIESYVNNATKKAKQSGFGRLDQYLNKVPGGDQIIPKLSQLAEVAQKHGQEAESLLKETIDEVSKVLSKKAAQAQELAKKAEKEGK
ncbi:hypothetical protein AOQ84DRAFT_324440 [Glonium stellatum]|uniref:Uncharacterized protein n=1 Tax=Glonium stellatum TaxID=574774 RepID=A0A8E2ET81_9PEZI|nr:hypothetical protein AOQ84DRAFT_324440 [Glonium stellatum]